MPDPVQSPEKELRFTRSAQAVVFWILAAVLVACGVTLLASALYRDINPFLPHPLWALLPLGLALAAARIGLKMTRHAYLILTPLGLEIFPFFRPDKGMRLVLWQEIHEAEMDRNLRRLTLHHDAQRTSGIHLSLAPIQKDRRALLAKAMAGRVSRP